ncbi:fungal-specific transcription factor domain-containing protein [Gautieria morchelliformis]|nr:fungal-specific transcription factor domain-containing protein [Gautieria morchelliformis]
MSSTRSSAKAVSCAECRRLKLKCDRVFPCSSCRKRGCDALCPNGSLPTRPRAVFHETERLKNKINILTDRVHNLEDALEQLQHQFQPDNSHPLLSDEFLAISRESESQERRKVTMKDRKVSGDERSSPEHDVAPDVGDDEVGEIKEALGTLALHSDGRSRFYGATATVESLFQSEFYEREPAQTPKVHQATGPESNILLGPGALWFPESEDSMTGDGRPWDGSPHRNAIGIDGNSPASLPITASHPIQEPGCHVPWFTSRLPADQVVKMTTHLEGQLPERRKAWSLCETYFTHATWLYSCIPRKDFLSDIFSPIYNSDVGKGTLTHSHDSISRGSQSDEPLLMERAAILFMAFAIGTLLDLTEPENHPPMVEQAEVYHESACTAISVAGTAERGSISCVQCLMLMSYYQLLLDKPGSSQRSWALIGLNVNIAQSIGLHRDSAWWNRSSEEVQRRREVFWELFSFERLQSLTLGLPPSLSLVHVDCELPQDFCELTSSTGETEHSFRWKRTNWTRNICSEVIDVLMVASKKPVPYSTILTLDRKLRDDLFLNLKGLCPRFLESHLTDPIGTVMQSVVDVLMQETTILLVHRAYLSHALHGPPQNIFGSKYGPSVLASFRSACHVVTLHRKLASLDSVLPFRLWFIWNHLLGAAIVLAALATKNPWCTIAPDALSQLDMAHELFERATSHGAARPTKAMSLVGRLRKNARQAYDIAHNSSQTAVQQQNVGSIVGTAQDVGQKLNEEVDKLFQSRRIMEIPEQQRSQYPMTMTTSTPSASNITTTPSSNQEESMSGSLASIFDTVHPELMEDLLSSNKLNEARYPMLDWSFKGLASWDNVPADAPAPDLTSQGVVYNTDQMGHNPLIDAQGTAYEVGLTPDARRIFRTGIFSSMMEGIEMVPGDVDAVAGGLTWDPAWKSLMDQLGIAEQQSIPA